MDIQSASNLIDEMKKMADQAGGNNSLVQGSSSGGFSQLLSKAIESVNQLQNEAGSVP